MYVCMSERCKPGRRFISHTFIVTERRWRILTPVHENIILKQLKINKKHMQCIRCTSPLTAALCTNTFTPGDMEDESFLWCIEALQLHHTTVPAASADSIMDVFSWAVWKKKQCLEERRQKRYLKEDDTKKQEIHNMCLTLGFNEYHQKAEGEYHFDSIYTWFILSLLLPPIKHRSSG